MAPAAPKEAPGGLLEHLRDMSVIARDATPAGETPERHLADLVPGLEHRLKGVIARSREFACQRP